MSGVKQVKVYLYNEITGGYTGEEMADESPLEANVYLIPPNATQTAPPDLIMGKWRRWTGSEWVYEDIEPIVIEVPTTAPITAESERTKRNILLQESDWVTFFDVPITNREQWLRYRQDLRDVPQQALFPNTISWPTKPQYLKG